LKCSTPFGVVVGFAMVFAELWPLAASAQRLSASSSASRGSPGVSPGRRRCAQRLSASSSASPSWKSRSSGPTPRAQRLSASSSASPAPSLARSPVTGCSTPFGVVVGFASRSRCRTAASASAQRLSASSSASRAGLARPEQLGRVLNAFRRRRRLRKPGSYPLISVDPCSTPFGVVVGFARPPSRWPRARRGAQRLSASSSASRRPPARHARLGRVLNAFRRRRRLRGRHQHVCHRDQRVLNAFRRRRRLRSPVATPRRSTGCAPDVHEHGTRQGPVRSAGGDV
jgi:hypothetical protein